jgi:hypothetical protein
MKVREVDVLLVADQMDIPKVGAVSGGLRPKVQVKWNGSGKRSGSFIHVLQVAAERALRAHSGDVKRTLIALTTGEYSSIIRV